MRKRMVNEELADVWGTMIDEKIEVLRQKAETCSEDKQKDIDNYIDGMVAAVALFNCLEKGRFVNDYERIKKMNSEDDV